MPYDTTLNDSWTEPLFEFIMGPDSDEPSVYELWFVKENLDDPPFISVTKDDEIYGVYLNVYNKNYYEYDFVKLSVSNSKKSAIKSVKSFAVSMPTLNDIYRYILKSQKRSGCES